MTDTVQKPFEPHKTPFSGRFGRGGAALTFTWGPNNGKPRCRASVHEEGRSIGFRQCEKVGKVQDGGGLWWCGTHSPEAHEKRKAKQAEHYQAYRDEQAARYAADKRRSNLLANAERYEVALRQIAEGHNDPRTLAQETLASS